MYLIALICIIITCMLSFLGTMGSFVYLFDGLSILMMTLLIIPSFLASGLGKEFLSIIKMLGNSKLQFEAEKYKKMLLAVDLLIKLSIYSGIFTIVISVIPLLHSLSDPASIGPNVSVILITLFYSLFLCLILYPIQVKLKAKLIDME